MPRAGLLWKLCPGALISLPVWQLVTMCTRFQTCNKRPLKTESQHFKTSHSSTTRSISEAPALDTHHWHCSAIPHAHARFHKHPLARGMHHPLPRRLQVLHQVERYPVVDLNIGVNDTHSRQPVRRFCTGRRFVRSASRRRPKMFAKHIHSGQSSPPIFEVRTSDI